MSDQDSQRKVRLSAIKFLSKREYTIRELGKKLVRKGFEISLIENVLHELITQHILSDERFAESYLRSKTGKGFGPLYIQHALWVRGVEEEIIDSMLEMDNSIWVKRAYHARQKRFGHKLPTEQRTLMKQIRFLQQRGFTSYQIKRVLSSDNEEDFL